MGTLCAASQSSMRPRVSFARKTIPRKTGRYRRPSHVQRVNRFTRWPNNEGARNGGATSTEPEKKYPFVGNSRLSRLSHWSARRTELVVPDLNASRFVVDAVEVVTSTRSFVYVAKSRRSSRCRAKLHHGASPRSS